MPTHFPSADYRKAAINVSQAAFTRHRTNRASTHASSCAGTKCTGGCILGSFSPGSSTQRAVQATQSSSSRGGMGRPLRSLGDGEYSPANPANLPALLWESSPQQEGSPPIPFLAPAAHRGCSSTKHACSEEEMLWHLPEPKSCEDLLARHGTWKGAERETCFSGLAADSSRHFRRGTREGWHRTSPAGRGPAPQPPPAARGAGRGLLAVGQPQASPASLGLSLPGSAPSHCAGSLPGARA